MHDYKIIPLPHLSSRSGDKLSTESTEFYKMFGNAVCKSESSYCAHDENKPVEQGVISLIFSSVIMYIPQFFSERQRRFGTNSSIFRMC
jgi:hypothetical protein